MSEPEVRLAVLLDEGGPPADAGTLGAIVARHHRRSTRRMRRVAASAVLVAAVSLATGALALARTPPGAPVASLAGAGHGRAHLPLVDERALVPGRSGAAQPGAASPVEAPRTGGPLAPVLSSAGLRRLFVHAGPVDVRAYLATARDQAAGRCEVPGSLVAEVSDAGAVAELVVLPGRAATSPLALSSRAWVVGRAEGAPMVVVVASAGRDVRRVAVSVGGAGSASMVPHGGWALLGVLLPAGARRAPEPAAGVPVTVRSFGAGGTLLGREPAVAVPDAAAAPGTCAKLEG
ncbi:MAG: hypothetical protein ACYCTE_01315 [Acidimicrobiales bacterium]